MNARRYLRQPAGQRAAAAAVLRPCTVYCPQAAAAAGSGVPASAAGRQAAPPPHQASWLACARSALHASHGRQLTKQLPAPGHSL